VCCTCQLIALLSLVSTCEQILLWYYTNLALKELQAVGRDIHGDKYWEVIDAVINFSSPQGLS